MRKSPVMHTRRLLVPTLSTFLAAAAPAAAQSPPPAPPPAAATLQASLHGTHGSKAHPLALRGDRVRVRGSLTPATAGQRVIVRVYRKQRRLSRRRVNVRPDGTFSTRVRARGDAPLTIRVVHRRSPQLDTARAPALHVHVQRPRLAYGATGALVRELQKGLAELRYRVPRSGVFDAATARAVTAYRKVNHMPRIGIAGGKVIRGVLAGRGAWKVRYPKLGRHVEADLSQQVLNLVDQGRVVRTFTTSSGAPVTPTIIGRFRVYRKDPGTNAIGMVHSSYFRGGYAIHGYISVPNYPASHGCLRVPIPDAWTIFRWLRYGDRVVVDR